MEGSGSHFSRNLGASPCCRCAVNVDSMVTGRSPDHPSPPVVAGAHPKGRTGGGQFCVGMAETYNVPVEMAETRYGIRVDEYSLHTDGAGAGEFRGGSDCGADLPGYGQAANPLPLGGTATRPGALMAGQTAALIISSSSMPMVRSIRPSHGRPSGDE